MNLTAILGFVAAAAVIWYGVLAHSVRPEIFLDSHAMILVLGGTAAAALIGFPLRQFRELVNFLMMGVFFPTKAGPSKVISQILMLSTRPEPSNVDPSVWQNFHPFLIEGYLLMQKADLSANEYKMILQGRRQRFNERYTWDARLLTALAKFPPAFGLLGASTGMIAMMSNLGTGGKEVIGPSMAIALVATFWGIAIANLIFLPLADRAVKLNSDDAKLRTMISSGLILIHQKVRPSVIHEHLIGFLPVAERDNPSFRQAIVFAQSKVAQQTNKAAA